MQLQSAVTRDALVGTLEPVPDDSKWKGSHEDDSPSAELQQAREENDSLKAPQWDADQIGQGDRAYEATLEG